MFNDVVFEFLVVFRNDIFRHFMCCPGAVRTRLGENSRIPSEIARINRNKHSTDKAAAEESECIHAYL
jgi:hypothetical protein